MKLEWIVSVVAAGICFVLGTIFGRIDENSYMEKQAIAHGVGKYVMDTQKRTKFVWVNAAAEKTEKAEKKDKTEE